MDAQIQNTIDDPLFLPPIDIVIPSPDIPHTSSPPEFLTLYHSEKFSGGNLSVEFFGKVYPVETIMFCDKPTLGSSVEGQGITPLAKEEIRPEGFIPEFFGMSIVPKVFVSQNSLEHERG